MTTTTDVTGGVLVPVADPLFTLGERHALAGFLSGYSGLTRDAYALDLRQHAAWCTQHGLRLFAAKRIDIESFRGDMEADGRARATIARRLCTIAGFYRYAEEEDLLVHSPAAHVRRPRLDYESHATALDRNELGALLVAAGLGTAQEHALMSLLALNGLPISEALGAGIQAMGSERGHRTLTVLRKGGKIVTIPLAPRTTRSLDLAIGERRQETSPGTPDTCGGSPRPRSDDPIPPPETTALKQICRLCVRYSLPWVSDRGERPAHRGLPPRSDQQILTSGDMAILIEVTNGRMTMGPATRSELRRLAREDLIAVGFGKGQLATLLPRGQRLLEAFRGEHQPPPDL